MQLTSAHISSPIAIGRKEEEERKRKEKKNTILIVSKFQPNARKKEERGQRSHSFHLGEQMRPFAAYFPFAWFYVWYCMYLCMYIVQIIHM